MNPALEKALADLNACRSSASVAALLRDAGCKGRQDSPCDCPVAVYLHRIGGDWGAVVGAVRVSDSNGMTFHLCHSVAQFIIAFDDGEYADLLAA